MNNESEVVFKGGDCFVSGGWVAKDGFARVRAGGVLTLAHRAAWAAKYGQVPVGKNVLHLCRNKACVNTEHLVLGTRMRGPKNGNGCIEWRGFKRKDGYGVAGKGMAAHRMAWIDAFGPIPDGMFVCHKCDNPACVNVEHLFLGSPLENVMDMESKGRSRRPKHEEHGMAKIDFATARWMRDMNGHVSQKTIAFVAGLTAQQTSNVLSGKHWRE